MRLVPGIIVGLALSGLLTTSLAPRAEAGCNLIPGATRSFTGTLGATNRPFAAPGEPVEIAVRPCDTASPGLAATGPDHVVSVVIKPAAGGTGKLIALATNCGGVDTGACAGSVCKQVSPATLDIVGRDAGRQLRFTFPDTDAQQLPDLDGLPLVGPATIAVTRVGDPLPCGLTIGTCAAQSGLTACIDTLFYDDGACGVSFAHPTFPSFTALPPPNDYRADCFHTAPPCTATATNFRVAVDGGGNLLVPMTWTGVLANTAAPVPRELTINVQPPVPVAGIPSQAFLASYTPEGGLLPPIFEPQAAPSPAPNTLRMFGSTDAPYTILRVARRRGACASGPKSGQACTGTQDCAGAACDTVCVGGGNDGTVCTTASACPGGTCGALFDAAGPAGTGGVVVQRLGPGICQQAPHGDCTVNADCPGDPGNPCVNYAFEAGVAHDLNGVVATSESFGFVVSERVQGGLLNGGAENPATANDDVIILRDRATGTVQPIGNEAVCLINESPQAPGRAVVKLADPPFQFHAVEGEGDVVAFLESEPDQNQCDANNDGDRSDTILRVFRLGPDEVTVGRNLPADAALLVNRQSLAVSNGLVFFRHPESASGASSSVWASIDPSGAGGNNDSSTGLGTGRKLSSDGRIVVFASYADNLLPSLAPGGRYVIARDLVTGTSKAVDANPGGTPVGGGWEAVSGNGRYVGFLSTQGVLPGSTGSSQAYVRDLQNDVTELVSVDSNEIAGTGSTNNLNLSYDGRYVVFADTGTNLAAPCNNGKSHVFLRDRQNGTTQCLTVNAQGVQGDGDGDYPQISDDGNIIAFQSTANNLDPTDVNSSTTQGDIFVYDRRTSPPTLKIASRDSAGVQLATLMYFPRLSGNGRFMAYENYSSVFCPTGVCVTVKDLQTGVLERGPKDANGLTVAGNTGVGSLSYDGRYLAMYSTWPDIVPGVTSTFEEVYVVDRLTGITKRIGLGDNGAPPTKRNYLPWISGDGRSVAFTAWSGLDADDTVATCNPSQHTLCNGGANAGAPCNNPTVCPGGTCSPVFDENCSDVYVHRLGGSEECGNSVLDFGEQCDPPGAPAGACGGNDCGPSCQCVDGAADLTGDGTLGQTVLQIVDARAGGTEGDLTTLCPAEQVVVGGGTAAFLRPEAAGNTTNPANCPLASPSLNAADGDAGDSVVHLSVLGGPAQNLGRAATALSLGATCSGNGTGCSLDADCPGVETCRPPYLAALVSEPQEGASILNGDGDALDTVLNVYKLTGTPGWQSIASVQAADAVDMKGNLAVFTTPEAAQGAGPLNGDGDTTDRVLRIYDASTAMLLNTPIIAAEDFVLGEPALIDCGSGPELHQVVAFRTREAAQGAGPLNGDGDTTDSVLYVIDYDLDAHLWTLIDKQIAVTPCPLEACDPRFPYRVAGKRVKFLTREPEQGNHDLNGDGDTTDLILQTIDVCTGALTPIAAVDETIDDDPALTGNDPTDDPTDDDSSVTVSSGARCYQGVTLLLVPATCLTDDDCPAGALCLPDQIVVATPIEDLDLDGVPDGVDNCPTTFNDTQSDLDGDGVGDACDVAQLGWCELTPRTACRAPILLGKSQLQITDRADDAKDAITWKWSKGEQTTLAEFGNPVAASSYALCLYDESGAAPELVFEAIALPGGTCGTKPCWKATGTTGFLFKSKTGTAQGVVQTKLKAGADGKAQAMVQGKGAKLLLPSLPLALPVRVQLQAGNGECWETVHDAAGMTTNTSEKFKGKDE